MKLLLLVVAMGLVLATTGCMSRNTTVDSAKTGTGTIPKTRLIEI